MTYTDSLGRKRNRRRRATNKTESQIVLKQLLRELDDHGADVLDGDRLTFRQLAKVYEEKRLFRPTVTPSGKVVGLKSYQTVRRRLKTLVTHFGVKRIRAITHADVESYKRTRLDTPVHRLKVKHEKLKAKIEALRPGDAGRIWIEPHRPHN